MRNHLNLLVVAIVVAVLAFAATLGGLIYLAISRANDSQSISKQIRSGLVHSCETVGDPLREAVLGQLLYQQHQAKHVNYGKFFPNIPRHELHRLLRAAAHKRRKYIRELQSVPPCSHRY